MTASRADDTPVRTIFFGSGGFGLPALDLLADDRSIELVGIVTAPARPAGRGGAVRPTPIAERASQLGLGPVLTPVRLRAPEAIAEVVGLRPELAILADYGQLVPPALLGLPYGALDLHPSLLPRHRGSTPIQAAILAGDDLTGVSLIRMDEDLDTGPIVARETLPLTGSEAAPDLERTLADMAAVMLGELLGSWIRGEIEPVEQEAAGATMTRSLRREDGRLDPARPALSLARQVRAYRPWPGTFIETVAGRIAVIEASDVDVGKPRSRGVLDETGMATADGRILALARVRPAGATAMSWADLLRGRPQLVGSSVVPGA